MLGREGRGERVGTGEREGSTELPRNNRELGGTRECTIGRIWESCGPGGSRGQMGTQVG